ncbi:hypothetical protein C1J03_20530 [Sulfitobacter sp. SK012]|uniref:hypothetical protein n=1 Tax=Sulfitobacter sp. SK012 TaxID=1389005 RepID=UPI000E0A9C08|nr:hypothetical protein [Sulfitobacter sp. SK012]AXI48175.1 hypothetical protein C1J03_20530 [Sulfitobacter sp. SK012]
MTKSGVKNFSFKTFGRFQITAPDGSDITPPSQKAQGLLAILLTSPDFCRPRSKLQDLLWSDREQDQGAASLRQEISGLNKRFRVFSQLLGTDRSIVWLEKLLFEADCDENGPTELASTRNREFLEGNNVKDPEFANWLRDRRTEFENKQPTPAKIRHGVDEVGPRTLVLSYSETASPLSKHLASAVSSGVRDWLPLDVRNVMPALLPADALLLEVDETRIGQDAYVQVVLKDVEKGNTLWRSALEFEVGKGGDVRNNLTKLINESIDRTLTTLSFDSSGLTPRNANAAIQAIERMFTSHGDSFDTLSRVFEEEYKSTGHGVFLAWQAFLSTYVVGGRKAHDRVAMSEEVRSLVHQALMSEPHNALVLALCSHVNAFTLGDYHSAFELADRSVKLQSNNPLGWMFRGVALINLGRLDEGRKSISQARNTTGEAPYRYLIDCYSCIAEMLSGDFQNAKAYGATSLSYMPDFAPTLRYLLATHLALGDTVAAEKTARRLKELEPDFELSLLAEPEYPNPLMKQYNVIDLKKLPKLL